MTIISGGGAFRKRGKNQLPDHGASVENLVDMINKQYDSVCECVEELILNGHGTPSRFILDEDGNSRATRNNSKDASKANVISQKNAEFMGNYIDSNVDFCKPCTIYIMSCNVGLEL